MLQSLGVSPVLSDDKLSDFSLTIDDNSIQTCLVNVESSDAVIVVLNQRYGPRLGKYGFDDVSATHLEYRRAKELKKPVYFYVRDRLEADYRTWLKNKKKSVEHPWVNAKDVGLFEFLDEHKELTADHRQNNWYWTFTSSVDLKSAIRRHIDQQIKPQLVVDAIADNRFPLFDVVQDTDLLQLGHVQSLKVQVTMTNVGGSAAFNFAARWKTKDAIRESKAIVAPGQSVVGTLLANLKMGGSEVQTELNLDYDSAMGVHVTETYDVKAFLKGGPTLSVLGGAVMTNRVFKAAPDVTVTIESPDK